METGSKDSKLPLAVQTVLYVGAIALIAAGMYYSLIYTFPDGKHLDIFGFVALWSRELLILAMPIVALVIVLARWLIRCFSTQKKDAL